MAVRLQREDFDLGHELRQIRAGREDIGAMVSFTGLVRDRHGETPVSGMELEHYPAMTLKSLEGIERQAAERWPLQAVLVIHRYGALLPGDQIVMVATASPHRAAAFEAAEFLMDFLKSRAPFWKKEISPDGSRWVDARESDETALDRWDTPPRN